MAQLQFEVSKLDSRLASGGEGEAFQAFIFQFFEPSLPHLHPYSAAGKDGGIDHLTTEPGQPRTVIECKFCGTNGFDEVRKRWKVTEGNLAKNLQPAGKPSQSQYEPWYRTDEPIVHYIFTTSAKLENPARCDELKDLIRDFFRGLAAKHSHLAHLGSLVVEVKDWNFIEARVPAFLRFRWFISERPNGMRLLASEDEAAQGFRAWLRSSKLPFYSRAQHLAIAPAPFGSNLPDEKELLGILDTDPGTLGLILVGRGGVGKTRLALEIGQTAATNGWSVWVVHRRLKPEALDQLATRIDTNSRILLVFDYVETHPEFANIVQHLADVVDTTGHHIRYVATCRSSYYNVIKGADRQRAIALSMTKPATEAWLTSYRQATVRHILAHAGIPLLERNIAACHDLPVLAAFLHWLHYGGRKEEMQSLLGKEDFGKWVIHRVQLSFPGREMDHSLARLIALFPIPSLGRSALTDDERGLFYRLEQDGWIEKADDPSAGETAWQTAHDVMADQVALEWLKPIGDAAHEWCIELLREAIRFHALPSALRSLQRLAEHLPISEGEWEKLLIQEAQREPQSWRELRSTLLRTSLLPAVSRVRLLAGLNDVFSGAEVDGEFQSTLGDLLRQLVETKTASDLEEGDRAALFSWVRRAIPHQRSLQYLQAWAVQCAPESFSEEVLSFILTRADKLATQYILCAWIRAGLPTASIEAPVKTWCQFHSNKTWFSFIAGAWLGGSGNPVVIQPFLDSWFARFLPTIQPSFVLCAWLKYANAPTAVQATVTQWLGAHETSLEARFVLGAWIEYANAPAIVQLSVTRWLDVHGTLLEAGYIIGAWIEHANAPAVVHANMTQWLSAHQTSLESSHVLSAWMEHANAPAVVQVSMAQWLDIHGMSLRACYILGAWIKHANAPEAVQARVTQWLATHGISLEARYVLGAWIEHANALAVVQTDVIRWLGAHATLLEASHVLVGWLDSNGSLTLVDHFVRDWLLIHAGTFEQGSYVMRTWLRAGGDSAFGLPFVREWLSVYEEEKDAQFVLAAWLKAKNSPHPLKEHVSKWLSRYGAMKEASHVIGPWLDGGGEYAVVSDAAISWANKYGKELEAWHVLVACLRANGAGDVFEGPAIQWLTVHAGELLASFVLSCWLKLGLDPNRISSFVERWLGAHLSHYRASNVISAWLDAGGNLAAVRAPMLRWLAARNSGDNTSWVLVSWLRAGGTREDVANYAEIYLAVNNRSKAAFAVRSAWADASHQAPPS